MGWISQNNFFSGQKNAKPFSKLGHSKRYNGLFFHKIKLSLNLLEIMLPNVQADSYDTIWRHLKRTFPHKTGIGELAIFKKLASLFLLWTTFWTVPINEAESLIPKGYYVRRQCEKVDSFWKNILLEILFYL